MWKQFRTAMAMLLVMTLLTGVVYPVTVTLVAQTVFPQAASGSMLVDREQTGRDPAHAVAAPNRFDWFNGVAPAEQGTMIGSEWIGQSFTRPEYFWGRLSATASFPYNAAASTGSNFGPLHPGLKAAAEARIAALRDAGGPTSGIPVDLVTASASGLDPHISLAAAEWQVPRIAARRGMKEYTVRDLVQRCTVHRGFGVLGEPCVHVLRLNLALDQLQTAR